MQVRTNREAAIQLGAGESLFVYLKAGSTVVSTAGRLRLAGAPRWVGGQVFRAQAMLGEGEAWHVEESGWVTLIAVAGGSTVQICHAKAPSPIMNWLRRTAGQWVAGRAARTTGTCA